MSLTTSLDSYEACVLLAERDSWVTSQSSQVRHWRVPRRAGRAWKIGYTHEIRVRVSECVEHMFFVVHVFCIRDVVASNNGLTGFARNHATTCQTRLKLGSAMYAGCLNFRGELIIYQGGTLVQQPWLYLPHYESNYKTHFRCSRLRIALVC